MVRFTLNGQAVSSDSPADTPLLWVLREELKLTGTKFGCGIAQCGACTIHLDGSAARACVTPLTAVENRSVTTIEGWQRTRALRSCQHGRQNRCPNAVTASRDRSCKQLRCLSRMPSQARAISFPTWTATCAAA
ncbi:MAG: hypothetical protein CM15mP74_17330 [Halieaceae bacterium]|nr:MAG: hypothetical protein CM15mP74_17330 [Halieaceae bacterium]